MVAVNSGSENTRHVTIIGAGIVGISCALNLQRDGYSVTVVDRLPPGEGTSLGNAGVMATGGVVPVPIPGLLAKIPKMLMDPLGPLSVRWSYLPKALPWLYRFMRNAAPEKVEKIADDGALDLDILVIAAGAWSGKLTSRLGDPVPLESERGYHVTIRNSGVELCGPVMATFGKFVATPMLPGLRLAGLVEFGGLSGPPNYSRARSLLGHAKHMFRASMFPTSLSGWAIGPRCRTVCRLSGRHPDSQTCSMPSATST